MKDFIHFIKIRQKIYHFKQYYKISNVYIMSNQWVEHVRKYAKANNITYMCAITEASKTYKKDDKLKSTPKK